MLQTGISFRLDLSKILTYKNHYIMEKIKNIKTVFKENELKHIEKIKGGGDDGDIEKGKIKKID